jgi:uncharacterized membrane protein
LVAKPDHRLSKVVTAHAIVMAGLSTAHSLRARGLRRTLLFATLGHAIPVLGEYLAVNVLRVLRHHAEPQLKGVPLAVALGWYNVAYGTLAVVESILNRAYPNKDQQSRILSPGTALVATSLDLLVDPFGLDLGLWEWSGDGAYATEIEGPNVKHGVPLLNFVGWLGLITSVTLAYQRLNPDDEIARPLLQPGAAGSPEVGRTAALLLLPYYLPAVVWTLKRRKPKYLLYSAPFSVASWAALRGR